MRNTIDRHLFNYMYSIISLCLVQKQVFSFENLKNNDWGIINSV